MNYLLSDDMESILYNQKNEYPKNNSFKPSINGAIRKSQYQGYTDRKAGNTEFLTIRINGIKEYVTTRNYSESQKIWSRHDNKEYPDPDELIRLSARFNLSFNSMLGLIAKLFLEREIYTWIKPQGSNIKKDSEPDRSGLYKFLGTILSENPDNIKILHQMEKANTFQIALQDLKNTMDVLQKTQKSISYSELEGIGKKDKTGIINKALAKNTSLKNKRVYYSDKKKINSCINSEKSLYRKKYKSPCNMYELYHAMKETDIQAILDTVKIDNRGIVCGNNKEFILIGNKDVEAMLNYCKESGLYLEETQLPSSKNLIFNILFHIYTFNVFNYQIFTEDFKERLQVGMFPSNTSQLSGFTDKEKNLLMRLFPQKSIEEIYKVLGELSQDVLIKIGSLLNTDFSHSHGFTIVSMKDEKQINGITIHIGFNGRTPDPEKSQYIDIPIPDSGKSLNFATLSKLGWKVWFDENHSVLMTTSIGFS